MPKRLSIVVPVYFNEESLWPLFERLKWFEAELGERDMTLELIFVDDGSGDGSFGRLLSIKRERPETKVVRLIRNFGAIAASKTGFRFVTGDCFTILAADLQDPVEQLLKMVDDWLAGFKLVISARQKRSDPLMTKILAAAYYRLVWLLVTTRYPQGGFDMMLMDKDILPYMRDSSRNTNPNMYVIWLGFQPKILRYDRQKRRFGKSRWTFRKKINFFVDTITGFSVVPIRIMSAFGLIVSLLSFMYGLWIGLNTAVLGNEVAGFTTIVVLMSFFSGMIILMLGLIGEYLWRTFDITNRKPESIVAESYL